MSASMRSAGRRRSSQRSSHLHSMPAQRACAALHSTAQPEPIHTPRCDCPVGVATKSMALCPAPAPAAAQHPGTLVATHSLTHSPHGLARSGRKRARPARGTPGPIGSQRAAVRSLARLFVCFFVRLFVCLFVCSFVRSLFVCLFV
jgi:hypothetical protein